MNKHAIIMMGLPLAGKSTWIENNVDKYGDYSIVSADEIKKTHKDYNPDYTEFLHEWSVKEAEKMVYKISSSGNPLIMDGGSINNSYTIRIINRLKEKGYKVTLVHIKTPMTTCIHRMSLRERKVPVDAIVLKAAKEMKQFHRLSPLADDVEVIDYFNHKNIFMDMDGVLASYQVLKSLDGKLDFVNGERFLHLPPVQPIIDKVKILYEKGHNIYILSAIPNCFAYKEKNIWLDKHTPFIDRKDRFFVNSGRHKAEMLRDLAHYLKLRKRDITMVEDTHETLLNIRNYGMRDMHLSEFLTFNFPKL